jgi:photosystem II stability/assembly factor-like uncharacterized protein
MTRVLLAVAAALLVVAPSASASPRFQPVSLGFVDAQHGVLAEDDWGCRQARGCRGRLLATSDGGVHWRVTATVAAGIELFPVRGSDVVYASTGDAMLVSVDGGVRWSRVPWGPAVIGFVTPSHGWRLGRATTLMRPPALLETRDGGASWTARSDPCTGDYGLPAALAFASGARGWVVCVTEAGAGYQGKEIWSTSDGGSRWTLAGRTHPIAPPEPAQQVGNLPGFGYPTGATFLGDGHGWLVQSRGEMLVTADGGRTWQRSPLTVRDEVVAQAADLLDETLGVVLLRGCTVRLVRTDLAARTATTLHRWSSPTRC